MAGLYIHIPYCKSKCAYCDFYSSPNTSQLDELINALSIEWQMRQNEVIEPIETIYIGGGTPSILSASQFNRLASALPISDNISEFTLEANPDDISHELAHVWKNNGVGRISMGIQSFDDIQLKSVGRRHTAAQAINAVEILKSSGIKELSLDLIYGLPGQSLDSWKMSLNTLLELHPQHFSAYMLSYEPGTRLYAQLISGKVTEADEDLIEAMYQHLCFAAKSAGYEHYEISNFALPGHRAKHNANYWRFLPYVGIGPSAHSFDGKLRRSNPLDIKKYIASIKSGNFAYVVEAETEDNQFNDMIMVALRTADGLDLNALSKEQYNSLMQRTKQIPKDYLIISNNRMFIPENRFLISDAIIRTLMV